MIIINNIYTIIIKMVLELSDLEFMLARIYLEGMKAPRNIPNYNPPEGWDMSEKMDGYRSRSDNRSNKLISRQNKVFNAPEWFINSLKLNQNENVIPFDGELFAGRENFEKMGAVRKKIPICKEWYEIKFHVYDCLHPSVKDKTFNERYKALKKYVLQLTQNWKEFVIHNPKFKGVSCPVVLCKHHTVKDKEHMNNFYKSILKKGGEGIMLKDPLSFYEGNRSHFLLKVKPVNDSECIIIDYKGGTNKYKGMLGAFICKPLINHGNYMTINNDTNLEFAMSGMDDSIRQSYKQTHPIGTIITYEYSGLTSTGKPRFARYIRIRDDVIIKNEVIPSKENIYKIINIFGKICKYKEANGEKQKCIAYKRALKTLHKLNDDSELNEKLQGIGESFKLKINEIIKTGTCSDYESIKNIKDPKLELIKIHKVGPKKAKELYERGFTSIQKLRDCNNLSEHLTEEQIKGLNYYEDLQQQIPRKEMIRHDNVLNKFFQKLDITDKSLTIAGSYRRGKSESGDIDVLVSSNDKNIFPLFIDKLKKMNYLIEDLATGEKKYYGICKLGKGIARRIDIMYTKPEEYPFAILYFTGSGGFNTTMREHALSMGYSMNEYGLKYLNKDNENQLEGQSFTSEKDIFDFLELDYVEPHNRL